MKNLGILIVVIAAVLYYIDVISLGANFIVPETLDAKRTMNAIETYEFADLFQQNKPTSKLAKTGYYTVVEGYMDSCAICKQLEADFVPFLRNRPDVVIRRVRFPENGLGQSFTGNSQQAINQQIVNYAERLAKYNFNRVKKIGSEYEISTCGTPHIEIYGPDRNLIATDKCTDKNLKSGLLFLRRWIGAEHS